MKFAMIVLAVIAGLVLALEAGLRLLAGFGNPLIYIADQQIGYLLAPSQRTRRFGNRIEINEYSMRSPAVAPTAPALRVLLLGDSVANGGWWTDQGDTISAILVRQLSLVAASGGKVPPSASPNVEVLNASANSWGPRNELAYLQRFGTFEARAVVLLINTDDLFATAPTSLPVGRDRNYPDRKPPSALAEVLSRYLLPGEPVPEELKAVQAEGGDRVGGNLQAIRQIQEIALDKNSHFMLLMTPLLREIGNPGPRDYELQARRRLAEFAEKQGITYIDFLPLFNAEKQPETLYRDHIHLSPTGNHFVSQALSAALAQQLLATEGQ
ncbi:MAG: SGNH/GDSL hydrolase family protein [Oscillatoria sp. Prado101]|jgi:hypothetical protein|nr:SGNH/GDSL hydrolase family protein [Oscillatoria sp. Prado101]